MEKKGSIILVPFPFTNQADSKIRPALVLASHRDDITILFISSRPSNKLSQTDFLVSQKHPDFAKTGLRTDSVIHVNKITSLDRKLSIKKIGALSQALLAGVDLQLKKYLSL